MRTISALLALTLVMACGKGKKADDSGGDSGQTGKIPQLEFKDSASASTIAGNVDSDTVLAQKSTNLVLGAMGLAVADESVRSKLQEHSTGARDSHCWLGPLIPQSTFTLDYTPCAQIGIAGGLIFNQDPLGPVSLDFKRVTMNDTREINGAMGFDAAGATPSHWALYDTLGTEPTPANRVPIALEVDGRDLSLTYDGGAFLRALNQNVALWGVLSLTPYGGNPIEVLVGSTDGGALVSSSEPAEPASLPWNYLSCRCPTAGLVSMDLGFDLTEVSFDLDDLLMGDDGVDDPEATLDVSASVSGSVESRYTACGEYDIAFDGSGGLDIEVSSDELKAAIQELCDTAVINDGARCTGLIQAADKVSSVTINIGPNRLENAVATEAAVDFDTSYCHP